MFYSWRITLPFQSVSGNFYHIEAGQEITPPLGSVGYHVQIRGFYTMLCQVYFSLMNFMQGLEIWPYLQFLVTYRPQ